MLAIRAARSLSLFVFAVLAARALATQEGCDVPEFMARADVRGLGLAEVRAEIIDVSVYGFAAFPTACVTEDTVFEAASLTKPLVAYVVMRLVDRGRLGLDDVLIERLPSLPLPEDDPRSGTVTIRMALAHSTGLDGADDAELWFVDEPGAAFRYYPAGYRLVQRVVEHLEGDTLEAIARREVFEPLGMESSSLVFREDLLDRVAVRHRMLGDAFQRTRNPARPANAAASLITTPADYGKFLRAMLDGEGLTPASRDAMLTPQVEVPETGCGVAWGIGWGLEPARGTFFHWGDDGAAKCFAIGSTADERAIVYFANSYYGMAIAGEIAERLVAGRSPAVEWLGYSSWDDPMRLARRDTVRDFVEGDADAGMETFERYASRYPELDMDGVASFVSWVLDGRGKHEGRARVLAWRIARQPENASLALDLARSLRESGDLGGAIASLRKALPLADPGMKPSVEARLHWLEGEQLAQENRGREPEHDRSQLEGSFGTWRIYSEGNELVFQPGESRSYRLTWMFATTYALEGLDWFRLRFELEDGRALSVVGLYSDGRIDEALRADGPG